MIIFRESLADALADIESGVIERAATVIVSRRRWEQLSHAERDRYHARAARLGVALRADDALSTHLVEIRADDDGPSLSTEQPM